MDRLINLARELKYPGTDKLYAAAREEDGRAAAQERAVRKRLAVTLRGWRFILLRMTPVRTVLQSRGRENVEGT